MKSQMDRIIEIGTALGLSPRQCKPTSFDIRWMLRRNMPRVLEIEQAAFAYPWDEQCFTNTLRSRNCIGMTAYFEEEVCGYMVYELNQKRLELLNLAVDPAVHRHGVGTALIEKLIGKLSPDRRNRIVTLVRDTNLPAQLFFRSMGFVATNVIDDHYDQCQDSAYRFEYRL